MEEVERELGPEESKTRKLEVKKVVDSSEERNEHYDSSELQQLASEEASRESPESRGEVSIRAKPEKPSMPPAPDPHKSEHSKKGSIVRTEASRMGLSSRKEKLKSLFWNYAEISDETGCTMLKARQFMKLLQDSAILDQVRVSKSKVEVVYAAAAGRKGMPFESFFNVIIKLAEMKYPESYRENRAQAIEMIVSSHLLPLFEKITTDVKVATRLKADESAYETLVYEEDVKIMLNSIFPVLKDIYDAYFGDPFKKARSVQQVAQIASKQLITFAREFDLLKNYYSSKQLAVSMMNTLVNYSDDQLTNSPEDVHVFFTLSDSEGNPLSQHYGVYFTLNRFFVFLFWTGVMGFETTKADTMEYSQAEKVYFLLAKMELSKGFADLAKKYFKHYSTPHSLIPHSSIINKLVINNPLNMKPAQSIKNPMVQPASRDAEDEKESSALEYCSDKLHRTFLSYCTISTNSNLNIMPQFKFISFLRNHGLIKQHGDAGPLLSPAEADLLFRKMLARIEETPPELSPHKPKLKEVKKDKLDFKAFYGAVLEIASRLRPELSPAHALINLVESELKAGEGQLRSSPEEMLEVLQDESVIEVLSYVHKIVALYFRSYTENTIMEYEVFIRFCRDFGIFPDLCSKSLLHSIFHALAYTNTAAPKESQFRRPMPSAQKKKVLESGEYLDSNLFVEALGLCALKSKAFEREGTPLEKILHFMEKLMQSHGIAKVKKMVGKTRLSADDIDPLYELRAIYRSYFGARQKGADNEELLNLVFAPDDS